MPEVFLLDIIEEREKINKKQKKDIRKLYNEWAREIKDQAKYFSKSGSAGSIEQQREFAKLYYQLRNASKTLSAEISSSVNVNATDMANQTVRLNKRWLDSLGLSTTQVADYKFSLAKEMAVRSILTGSVYDSGYSLSTRVWKAVDGNMKDIYQIVAKGVAENKNVYEIAKELEKYVNPDARLPWRVYYNTNSGGIYRVHNATVDYNAQRLAKTMIQHTYQQTLVAVTRDNPFVDGYVWHADGGHPCQLCMDRDGNIYTADDLPLDHPNGQCTIEPHVDTEKAKKDLAGWYENPVLYPDIQSFTNGMNFRPSGS